MAITDLTAQDLIDFEREIADLYEEGKIRAPIHLRGGNEQVLIDVFNTNEIQEQDWVVATWCSHLECLLKGVPREKVKQAILDRRSITLCFAEQNVISSAIVGSTPSIAVGLAMGAHFKNSDQRVFCFIGDMGALTAQARENIAYAQKHRLPVIFIVADNGLSVKTETRKVWNMREQDNFLAEINWDKGNVVYYKYKNSWPHSGTGKFINLW